jgi:hypothetical protein
MGRQSALAHIYHKKCQREGRDPITSKFPRAAIVTAGDLDVLGADVPIAQLRVVHSRGRPRCRGAGPCGHKRSTAQINANWSTTGLLDDRLVSDFNVTRS